jgi:hypothetical protein
VTLDVFPNPLEAVQGLLEQGKPAHWPTATISVEFPKVAIKVPHLQYAWDGTPSQQLNQQRVTIRVTAWTPKGRVSEGIDLAQLVKAYLLDNGSALVWRIRPGPGPLPGTDPDTNLEFCTFTLTAQTRPVRVA